MQCDQHYTRGLFESMGGISNSAGETGETAKHTWLLELLARGDISAPVLLATASPIMVLEFN